MGQVLYRKYRSKSLGELVGQDHITDGIGRAIKAGIISHAYLFTGPRGTGKTSVARILAHMLNDFEYDDPCTHMDIIEIDAASNRRIDEIRDLRDKVHIAPTTGKYKVYIIDEVHMLTKEAFNALLKTLEEPPSHAIFMLATTELHKVPETIISRTQRHSLKPIEKSVIIAHLRTIADKESITIDDESLALIADHANGGFRDAISLMDQIRHGADKITTDTVADSLGIPPSALLSELWANITTKSPDSALTLKSLLDRGFQSTKIASELLRHAIDNSNVEIAEKLLEVEGSYNPEMKLRLLIMSLTAPSTVTQPAPAPTPVATVITPKTHVTPEPPKPAEPPIETPAETVASSEAPSPHSEDTWAKVLESIRVAGHSVYGPLRLAEAHLTEEVLSLRLRFPFHIKRIAESQNMKIIAETFETITGKSIKIDVGKLEATTSKPAEEPKPVAKEPINLPEEPEDSKELMNDPLSIVKNVFGNAEVL